MRNAVHIHYSTGLRCLLTFCWMNRQHPIIELHSGVPQTHNNPEKELSDLPPWTAVTCLVLSHVCMWGCEYTRAQQTGCSGGSVSVLYRARAFSPHLCLCLSEAGGVKEPFSERNSILLQHTITVTQFSSCFPVLLENRGLKRYISLNSRADFNCVCVIIKYLFSVCSRMWIALWELEHNIKM